MTLKERLAAAGLMIDDKTAARFDRYADILLSENEKYNLTAVRDRAGIEERHFFDSLSPLLTGAFPAGARRVLDLGTGGGFPGLPLLFCRPDLQMTLMDSTEKKCGFVRAVLAREGLDAEVIAGRAEEIAGERRGSYDLVVSRAVAELKILVELALPFLKKGGELIAYKGERAAEEAAGAGNAIAVLGGGEPRIVPTASGGNLVIIKKTGDTPETYPRSYARMKKKPL